MKKFNRLVNYFTLAITAILISGCGSGGSSDTPKEAEVPHQSASASLTTTSSNTISVTDPASPIVGAKVYIPSTAVIDPVTVVIGYEDTPPAPFNADAQNMGATVVSKIIIPHVANGGISRFSDVVEVTIPYDKTVAPDIPPIVVYWDEDAKIYRPVTVKSIDKTNGTITFMTSHFSRFMAVVVTKLGLAIPAVDTGFKIGTDSILHQNFGSYEYGGHCAAFAAISAHYFSMKKPKQLYDFAQDDVSEQPLDDELVRSALTYVYSLYSQKLATVNSTRIALENEKDTGIAMWEQLLVTQQPVILSLRGPGGFGHAVTAYAYDSENARFKIYDSNYPKNEVTFDWDLVRGFGSYSRDYGVTFTDIGFYSGDVFGAPSQFNTIISDWESGKLKDYFNNLAVDKLEGGRQVLVFGSDVKIGVPYQNKVALSGHFTSPADTKNTKNYLWVMQNGKPASVSEIPSSGDFSFNVDGTNSTNTEVVLTVSGSNRDQWNGFVAYGKFSLTGQNFFTNFGFEKGTLDSWSAYTYFRNTGRTLNTTKAYIVQPGNDPIATDLPTVYFGKYAAKVNDSDNDYHATRLSQKAIVPSTSNPQIRFSWAAVLEDPQHSPDDQPYVDVIVRNNTKSIEIYKRRYYTADPKWTGWKSYTYNGSDWKAIPWQTALISGLAQYAGDEIELIIEGADCNQGGHGGYVYIDGEE